MKTGKYISLGDYKNIKIGYGTVDYKNLKTVYLKFNSWLEPLDCDNDFEKILIKSRRKIKDIIFKKNFENFKRESIVDLDIKTKGIKIDKKSFMNLEITLFVNNQFDIKNIGFLESKKNIIFDGKFTKLIYSDNYLTMNGIFFKFPPLALSWSNFNFFNCNSTIFNFLFNLVVFAVRA